MTAPALPAPSARDAELRAALLPIIEACEWQSARTLITAHLKATEQAIASQVESLFVEWRELPVEDRPDFLTFAHARRNPKIQSNETESRP